MYKYANKHVDVLKQIPFQDFTTDKDIFYNLIREPNKYGTFDNLLKCYCVICKEMWDDYNHTSIITYNKETSTFYFRDLESTKVEIIKANKYKRTKLANSVLDNNFQNRNIKKYHGLIVQKKPGIPRQEVKKLREDFLKFAHRYNQNIDFYKRNKIEIPEDWLEHLYILLKEMTEKATFFYKQRGSIILAQELANVLNNQSIILYSMNLIKIGHNRTKVMRNIRQNKAFMFGELQITK